MTEKSVRPHWTTGKRWMIALSAVFWLGFATATLFLGSVAFRECVKGDEECISGVLLVGTMGVGCAVWALGFARLRTRRFVIRVDQGRFLLIEQGRGRARVRCLAYGAVRSVEVVGTHPSSFRIRLHPRNRWMPMEFGFLLSATDASDLAAFIRTAEACRSATSAS